MKLFAVLLGTAALLASAEVAPDCSLGAGWTQHGPNRTYEGDNLYEYMNGNSEGYFIYGFVKMKGVTCRKGEDTIHVDISEFADSESAYGMFTANRDARLAAEQFGQVAPRKAIVVKDKYFLEIAAEPDKDHSAVLGELMKALETKVPGEPRLPAAVSWFAPEGMSVGFPRLVPQSVLGIGALKRGYVAQYENKARAFVVREATADSAKAVLEKIRGRFADTADAGIGDGGFTVSDKYLGRLAMFRKGQFIAGYVGVPEGLEPAALAQALGERVR